MWISGGFESPETARGGGLCVVTNFVASIDVVAIDPGGRVPPELELIDIEVMIDGAGRSQRPVFKGFLRADRGKWERKDVGSTWPTSWAL